MLYIIDYSDILHNISIFWNIFETSAFLHIFTIELPPSHPAFLGWFANSNRRQGALKRGRGAELPKRMAAHRRLCELQWHGSMRGITEVWAKDGAKTRDSMSIFYENQYEIFEHISSIYIWRLSDHPSHEISSPVISC